MSSGLQLPFTYFGTATIKACGLQIAFMPNLKHKIQLIYRQAVSMANTLILYIEFIILDRLSF